MADLSGHENMRGGRIYGMPDAHLMELQSRARQVLATFNATPMWDMDRRGAILGEALGSVGRCMVLSPITWEYGRYIHIGDNVFINFDCLFLDGADIRVGDNTAIGPRVQLLTASHPVDPAERTRRDAATGEPFGAHCINRPITIGRNCWIGAGAIIVGGVSIGDDTTIGAGSVVTRDVPAGVVAAGNPCRVIRPAAAVRPSSDG